MTIDRALSKLNVCSRSQALRLVREGRVKINGHTEVNAARWIDLDRDRISVDGKTVGKANPVYLMLHKPRGLVTTMSDENDRATVYQCFHSTSHPRLIPVGRLDKASEGLLLFTNDTDWANRITDPDSHLDKIYHVQIDQVPTAIMLELLEKGIKGKEGKRLKVKGARILRAGKKNSWLEIVLDEGKNRQIRRILESLDVQVKRLIRIAIGPLSLGKLAKGQYRPLKTDEIRALHNALNHASRISTKH